MHAFQFTKKGPRKDPGRPIYALSGDDAYLRDLSIRRIVLDALGPAAPGDDMGLIRLAGDHAKLADVLDEVRTLPFLSKRKVVVVDNADPFVTAHRKELEAYAEKPSTAGILVLSCKSFPGNTRLAKLVEKAGMAIDCKTPPERDLPAWLVELARDSGGVKLDNDAALLMVELVGPSVGLLASEVEKLAVFVGDRRQVRRDDVAKMVGSGRIEQIWGVIDAATLGRGGEALGDLDVLLASGEAPIKILAAVNSSLQKLHHAGQLRRAQHSLKDACAIAGIYPGAVEKAGKQHAHLGPNRVDAIPSMLLQADLDMKGGSQLSPRIVLENLMLRLSGPRRD